MRVGLDEELQRELAALLDLLPDLAEPPHSNFVPLVDVAAAALLCEKPNLLLARQIRENLSRRVRRRSPLVQALKGGGTPPVRVILGLATLLYFALPILFLYGRRLLGQETIFGVDSSLVALVAVAGAVGSIVSIMVRIRDFGTLADPDPTVLFFTGFFKPVVGTAFALFIFTVLKAGILPVTIDPEKAVYFFAALAFVSGFSERFASDVATRTEDVVRSSSTSV
jgi:hypothetical protein